MLWPLANMARYGTQRWSGPRCNWCHSFTHNAAIACPLRKLCLPSAQLPLQPHPGLGMGPGREQALRMAGREAGNTPVSEEGGHGAGQGGARAVRLSTEPRPGTVLHAPLGGPLLPPRHVVPPEVDADMHVYGTADPVVSEPGGAAAAAGGVAGGERCPGGVAGGRRRPGG